MANSPTSWDGRPLRNPCPLCGRTFFADTPRTEKKDYWHKIWCRALENMPYKRYKTGFAKGQMYGKWTALGRALDYTPKSPGAPVWQAWFNGRKPEKKRVKKLLLLASTGPMTPAFLKALKQQD